MVFGFVPNLHLGRKEDRHGRIQTHEPSGFNPYLKPWRVSRPVSAANPPSIAGGGRAHEDVQGVSPKRGKTWLLKEATSQSFSDTARVKKNDLLPF